MLHDVVEDTDVTLEDVRSEFGPVIAHLVDGVTKMERIGEFRQLDQDDKQGHAQAESLRKLLLAMADDVRVVLIKLADRLHNMRTLQHLDIERQQRIAQETLEYLRTIGKPDGYLADQMGTGGPFPALSGTGCVPATGQAAG